jgi:hypothetical protein
VIAGKRYTFFGQGNVTPLHQSELTGHVRLPGLVISPGSGTAPTASTASAHGQLFLSDPGGTLTLTLIAPSHPDSEALPAVFSYKVTNASGRFRGDGGTGQVVIVTDPSGPGSNAGSATQHGTFTVVFIPDVTTSTNGS